MSRKTEIGTQENEKGTKEEEINEDVDEEGRTRTRRG